MIAIDTCANQFENVLTKDLESAMWKALDMDEFSNEMVYGSFPNGQLSGMGTGSTINACSQCSTNSNSTSGCGTCCR